MKMKGMINGHGWLGYKSYRKGCFKKKKKKKKVIQKRNRNTAEITLFKGKITIFKHTSYLSYALSSPMLMKSLVFAI